MLDSALKTLSENCNVISNIFTVLDFEKEKYTQILGDVQGGKSFVIKSIAYLFGLITHYEFDENMSVVILLRNLWCDYDQMRHGIHSFNQMIKEKLPDCDYTMNSIYVGKATEKELLNVITSTKQKKVIIAICNESQLEKLNKTLDNQNYVLIIDEVDVVKYSPESSGYIQILNNLSDKSKHVFGVSGTCFEAFFNEEYLNGHRVFTLQKAHNYKSIDKIKFVPFENKSKPPTSKKSNQLQLDSNLIPFYNYIYEKDPFENHPIVVLHKTSNLKEQHIKTMEILIDNWESKFAVIVHDGDGIRLYHHSLKKIDSITTPDTHKKSENQSGVHIFTKVGIQSVLQFLKENGGVDIFSHIIIVSGLLAGRGINFVSRDYIWHLTHEYFLPASSTRVSEMIQSMRLLGCYNDDIPLECHTTTKTISCIIKGYNLQKDIVYRLKNEDVTKVVKDYISQVTFFKEKIPKGKLSRKKIYLQKTLLQNDGGIPWTEFIGKEEEEYSSVEEGDVPENWEESYFVLENALTGRYIQPYRKVYEYLKDEYSDTWVHRKDIVEWYVEEFCVNKSTFKSLMTEMLTREEHIIKYDPDVHRRGMIYRMDGKEYSIHVV